MSARLFGKTGEVAGLEADIDKELTIGRSSDNDFALVAEGVSPHHARILWDAKASCYRLQKSSPGVPMALDGVEVESEAKLGRFHVITLGTGHDLFFIRRPAQAPQRRRGKGPKTVIGSGSGPAKAPDFAATSSKAPDRSAKTGSQTLFRPEDRSPSLPGFLDDVAAGKEGRADRSAHDSTAGGQTVHQSLGEIALPSLGRKVSSPPDEPRTSFVLMVEMPDGETRRIEVAPGEHVIGRIPGCEVRLDHATVSRRHARVTVSPRSVELCDLSRTNPSKIEETPIEGPVSWEEGTVVEVGAVKITLVSD